MQKVFIFCLVIFTLYTCQSDEKINDDEIYSFLQSCYENYFDNYDINVTSTLNDFEIQLMEEGRLTDTTGAAYKNLFSTLDTANYFSPPLYTKNFKQVLLYKNPKNVLNCAVNVFSLDSTRIAQTHFAKIENKIHQEVTSEEEVSIHYFFNIYQNQLSNEEIKKPYIKQNILLLLYRWYYMSQEKIKEASKNSVEK